MPFDESVPVYYLDSRGHVVEHVNVGGQELHLHYRDSPESDTTTLHGLRLTTPLRTVIDIAPTVDGDQLEILVQDCLDRGLFTVEEAWARISEPDMVVDPGTGALARLLSELGWRRGRVDGVAQVLPWIDEHDWIEGIAAEGQRDPA